MKIVNKILIILLTFVLMFGMVACGKENNKENNDSEQQATYKTIKSNGDKVKIGVISDLHVNQGAAGVSGSPWENSAVYLKMACDYYATQDIDVLLITGDYVDYCSKGNYYALKKAFEKAYGKPENAPAIILAAGNHEFVSIDSQGRARNIETIKEVYGYQKMYLKDWIAVDLWNGNPEDKKVDSPIQVIRVNDVTIVGFSPDLVGNAYSPESVEKLDKILGDATKNSDKPVILGMHMPIDEYGMGGWCEIPRDRNPNVNMRIKRIPELFAKYPNLVSCTGHTHFSFLHGKNINQDDGYTNINVGPAVTYYPNDIITPDDGKSIYANNWLGEGERIYNTNAYGEVYLYSMEGEVLNKQAHIHEGLLLTFEDDNLKVDRIDLNHGKMYDGAESYIVPYGITNENKTEKFTYIIKDIKEKAKDTPLVFGSDDKVELNIKKNSITATFPSVKQIHDVECYKIDFYYDNNLYTTKYWLSDFFINPDKRATYNVTVELKDGNKNINKYKVVVTPRDFYGNQFDNSAISS